MRRNKEEIVMKILAICSRESGVNKTRLVYGANLNFRTIEPYLDLLANKGYITEINGRYKTTLTGDTIICQ